MLFVPYPDGFTPIDPMPVDPGQVGLEIQQELTHWFIMQDPTVVQLIPKERVRQPNGSFTVTDGAPRPQQIVKMIFPAGNSDGIIDSGDGNEREYDFIVVGEWDATIKLDDYWVDPSGQKYIVTGVSAYNGYEVKANIKSFGPEALYA